MFAIIFGEILSKNSKIFWEFQNFNKIENVHKNLKILSKKAIFLVCCEFCVTSRSTAPAPYAATLDKDAYDGPCLWSQGKIPAGGTDNISKKKHRWAQRWGG